mgnify:CR=1 FL=1
MNFFKPSKNDIVQVIFDDPAEYDTNYEPPGGPVECVVVGWFEEQTKDLIRIAWLKETKEKPYCGMCIPMGCVKKIKTISKSDSPMGFFLN